MSPLFAILNFGSLAGLALLVWIVWHPAWQRRRAEAPLRTELRARPTLDFSTKVMSKALLLGAGLPMPDFRPAHHPADRYAAVVAVIASACSSSSARLALISALAKQTPMA
jgi:hypothetical protein